jgi:hypothetical protein
VLGGPLAVVLSNDEEDGDAQEEALRLLKEAA